MALNAATLGNAIKVAFVANGAADNAATAALCLAIATAVVTHIQSSGEVAVVTTCGAGPGTGTGAMT
jgi:hypothetical protein